MNSVVYSSSTGGFATQVHGDREYFKADATARALSLGYPPELIERALKRYRLAA